MLSTLVIRSVKSIDASDSQRADGSGFAGQWMDINGGELTIDAARWERLLDENEIPVGMPLMAFNGCTLEFLDMGEMITGETVTLPSGEDYTAKRDGFQILNYCIVGHSPMLVQFITMAFQASLGIVAAPAAAAPAPAAPTGSTFKRRKRTRTGSAAATKTVDPAKTTKPTGSKKP